MKQQISLSEHFTYSKLFRFCISSVIMMVFTSIYGVVDGFFVSNYAGKTAFAAINLVMPALMIFASVGFMIGTGGSALVSMNLGMEEEERANRYFSMMVILTVLAGGVITILGLIFMEPIALFLGATDDMLAYCVSYGRVCAIFTIFYMLQNLFQSFLIVAERPKIGLYVTIAAGCTNMVLDALLVGALDLGVTGAALATGISQCVGGLSPIVYLMSKRNDSRLHFVKTGLELRPILKACGNGASELMSNIAGSVVSMVYNFQLLRYLGENGVSAYGTIMYVQFVFVAIFIGYAISVAPIIGFHYGAANHDELKNLFKKSEIIVSSLGVILFVAAELLAAPVAKLYVGYDVELYELTVHGSRLFAFSFLFMGMNIFASSFFTALSNGAISAIISFLRTLVFETGAVLILPPIIGTDGIWIAVFFAEIMSFIVGTTFLIKKRNVYHYI